MEIKVGSRTYEVRKPNEIIEVGGEFYGRHTSKDCTIDIAAKFDQVTRNESLLHELVHAICYMQGLEALNNDEHAVDLLAKGLYLVIIDNPEFMTMQNA